MVAGDVFRVEVRGSYGRVSTSTTHTIVLKLGSTTLLSNTYITSTSSSGIFEFDGLITVRAIGASGTLAADLTGQFCKNNGVDVEPFLSTGGAVTVDTTADQTWDFTYQFSTNSGSNNIVVNNAMLTKL